LRCRGLATLEGGWSVETQIGHLVDQTITADLHEHGFGWSSWPQFPNEPPVAFEETATARAVAEELRDTELDEGGECV
jgi:hypothetical protein